MDDIQLAPEPASISDDERVHLPERTLSLLEITQVSILSYFYDDVSSSTFPKPWSKAL